MEYEFTVNVPFPFTHSWPAQYAGREGNCGVAGRWPDKPAAESR